ncbi:MAG: glycosyltransferase [Deltaproteobacteria bacterium]|nr:glycosyltransferase [Deltaproteobacteria bacterium]
MEESIALDELSSTTKNLFFSKSDLGSTGGSKLQGGLRTQGYYKKSIKNKPLFSIITVCFNAEATIERTIQSVLGQSWDNIEYIIIDGGSDDGTRDVLLKYSDQIDYWISEPDEGLYDAMNKGITFSTGDYCGILNADDWYHPGSLEKVAKLTDRADIIFGDLIFVKDHQEVRYRAKLESINTRMKIWHPACFIRRALHLEVLYDTRFKSSADWDLLLALYSRGCSFIKIDEVLTYMSHGGMTSDSKGFLLRAREDLIIQKKYGLKSAGVRYILRIIKHYALFWDR